MEINPDAEIEAVTSAYSAETSDAFRLETYDYILDAIDSLSEKVHLIRTATSLPRVAFFSSMGAALKLDPQRIRVAPFSRVAGCPLAAALRRRLKQGEPPAHDFLCVYSDEVLKNRGTLPSDTDASVWDVRKARINGTIAHTTAIFGFTLASLVVQHLCIRNS